MAIHIKILDTGPRCFSEEEARNAEWQKIFGNTNAVFANNGTSELGTTITSFPKKVEGPAEADANTEATYTITQYTKEPASEADKGLMKWALSIDGQTLKNKNNKKDYLKLSKKTRTECTTDFMAIEDEEKRIDAIREYAILDAKIESNPDAKITLKFSKWLDGHKVKIEAFGGSPDGEEGHFVETTVKAKPEVIGMQWVNKKELPITFSNYTQEKHLKISTLGLKEKDIKITFHDHKKTNNEQHIRFQENQQNKTVKIEGRTTLKEIKLKVLKKNEAYTPPANEVVYEIGNPRTLSNDVERPELKLEAHVKKEAENIINTESNLVFAKHLTVYPTEKIVDTYFATKVKKKVAKADGTEQEVEIYEAVNELSIGQKTYLVADCANLADKTIKLKIHEKAGTNGKLLIQANEDDYFKVCKPKKEGEKTFTELPKNDWIEGTVDADTNQAVAELVMRPKTKDMSSKKEAVAKSLEGWKEALYEREDETEAGKKAKEEAKEQATARANEAFTTLTRDTDADEDKNKKSKPKTIFGPKTIEVGKEAVFVLETYKPGNTEADKKNIRWSLYKQGDPKTDYIVINTKSKTGLYTYAKMELVNKKNQLTIVFDEALEGKKIQIEPFRGSPDITQPPNRGYIKTVTIQEQEKAKLVKKLTTKLFVSAECCEGEEGDISYVNKKGITKLQHGGLLFPFRKMPLNHPNSLKNAKYDSYNYYYNEKNAATFAYGRKSKKTNKIVRLHAARDLYYDVSEPIYAIADGIVKRVAFFYYDTWVIEIEHEHEAKIAKTKGHKILVRYGEVKKGSAILVKEGEKVTRGQKIGEIGLLNPYVRQPYPDKRGMLHIEMYTGEGSGNLSDKSVKYSDMLYATSKKNKGITFQRRKDLFDPLDLLNEMIKTGKKENWIE